MIVASLIIIPILLTIKKDIKSCGSQPEKSKQTFVHREEITYKVALYLPQNWH